MTQCYINTDKIIYTRPSHDLLEEGYTPKLSITENGALIINVGGHCISLTIEEWHKAAIEYTSKREKKYVNNRTAKKI